MTTGRVIQFRRGKKTIHEKHFLIEIPQVLSREDALKFLGNEVIWTSPGKLKKQIKGKIASTHGNKGIVRAIFERGLPGQAVTTEVNILTKEIKDKK